MSIPGRKVSDLNQKLAGLGSEFEAWRQRSAEQGDLAKHHTQIRRVIEQLEVCRCRCEQEVKDADRAGASLERCRELEAMILDVHRIWEFFRGKLVLRGLNWFSRYLE